LYIMTSVNDTANRLLYDLLGAKTESGN
jgi:hypothetical protein